MTTTKDVKIGHTSITWRDEDIVESVRVLSEFGFAGIETFGWVLENMEAGGQADLFEQYHIPLVSSYFSLEIVDDSKKDEVSDKLNRWSALLLKHGCNTVVLGGNSLDRSAYRFADHREKVIANINNIGKYLADKGIVCCFHPHTGTPVQTEAEIRAVMEAVDPGYVAFAPDIGQIQKGGTDALQIVKDYYPLLSHVHFKDYIGGEMEYDAHGDEIDKSGYLGYTPLGDGVVDLEGILDLLEKNKFSGYAMVELDGRHYGKTDYSIDDVEEKILKNKKFLENLGYQLNGKK